MVSKEVLDLKLDAIKRDTNALIPDVSSINDKLDDLESRIEAIENESGSQSQ